MVKKVKYILKTDNREEFKKLVDLIEGNQTKSESGTTACSDAGGGDEQVKTAGSAGREPGLAELKALIEERLAEQEDFLFTSDDPEVAYNNEELRRVYDVLLGIEARR